MLHVTVHNSVVLLCALSFMTNKRNHYRLPHMFQFGPLPCFLPPRQHTTLLPKQQGIMAWSSNMRLITKFYVDQRINIPWVSPGERERKRSKRRIFDISGAFPAYFRNFLSTTFKTKCLNDCIFFPYSLTSYTFAFTLRFLWYTQENNNTSSKNEISGIPALWPRWTGRENFQNFLEPL